MRNRNKKYVENIENLERDNAWFVYLLYRVGFFVQAVLKVEYK